jgi:hypothetical protein
MQITDYQAKYFAYDITRRCAPNSAEKLAGAVAGAQVDLNPHQVDAALFAFSSPLSKGALLADEVAAERQLRDVATIVHRSRQRWKRDELAGVLRDLGWIGEFGLAPDNGARVDQRYEEFRDLRRLTSEILNVDVAYTPGRAPAV